MDWRLGKITAVKGAQISVTYSVRGFNAKGPPMHRVQRSARHISILYSTGDLMVNTRNISPPLELKKICDLEFKFNTIWDKFFLKLIYSL